MATADATLRVVRGYHRAWTSKNFDQVGRFLARDLVTEVPLNTYDGREQFLAALTGFGRFVTSVDLLAEFSHGDEAMLLYDIVTGPVGTIRIAEHFTIADHRITRIRQIHDTVALRTAGFGANVK
jgi:hypothetical protein